MTFVIITPAGAGDDADSAADDWAGAGVGTGFFGRVRLVVLDDGVADEDEDVDDLRSLESLSWLTGDARLLLDCFNNFSSLSLELLAACLIGFV